jgi:SAM-dependent methyltransferase
MTAGAQAPIAARSRRSFDSCPFCGGAISSRYSGIRDRLDTTAERFEVHECAGCGAGLLNPAPSGDLSAYYPANYLSAEGDAPKGGGAGGFDLERWYRYDQYRYDFKLLVRATGTSIAGVGSYLDLGCGSGERVAYAHEQGCARAVGVDKFDYAKSAARSEVSLINAEILEFAPAERFAAVSMFHVLEHLEEPHAVLAHIRERILAPGGHVIIQVPNYGSLERRLFGSRWFGLDVPRHLWHFNERAIRRLLGTQGYAPRAIFQSNAPLHPVTIASSVNREIDVQRIWAKRERGAAYTRSMTLLWAGLTALTMPLSMLQSLCGRASMLTVVASAR